MDWLENVDKGTIEMWRRVAMSRPVVPFMLNVQTHHPHDRGPYHLPFGEVGIAGGLADAERHATARFFDDRLHFRVETSSVYAERVFVVGIGRRMFSLTIR